MNGSGTNTPGARIGPLHGGAPGLQGLRRWLLATREAPEMYRSVGFETVTEPSRFMQRLQLLDGLNGTPEDSDRGAIKPR